MWGRYNLTRWLNMFPLWTRVWAGPKVYYLRTHPSARFLLDHPFLKEHLEHCPNAKICDSMMGQTYSFSERRLSGDLAHGRIPPKNASTTQIKSTKRVPRLFFEKSCHPQYSAQSTGLCAISPCKRCSKSPLWCMRPNINLRKLGS